MAGLIMDYSGLCLCCALNFEAMEDQGLSYEEDADYLSFPRECKNLPLYLNTKEKWMVSRYSINTYVQYLSYSLLIIAKLPNDELTGNHTLSLSPLCL